MSSAPPSGPGPHQPPSGGTPETGPASADTVRPPPTEAGPGGVPYPFTEVQASGEFAELRHAHRSFAFPLTVAFIAWYLAYVLLSSYAGGFMALKILGHVNVALVLGLAQFLTTFLIAWWYSRHAAARLDPRAEAIKTRLEGDA
ncbi:DUF485 domain-containing protein [Streptomyces pinistramenti]|uniref:DUF485 domain-containing protein n=1 Tax=Streptomyces pinistramenti TaxID=2884812 RepID=UPI001D069623|nr:DUF485 domain-containing protein [Streptomyces pinistramenti]MCB5907327.1 DUF485 domain-containing protein [Streptomyces pinistramenti]